MRMDKRYTRVRDLLAAPVVPRTTNGRIALCHTCQRSVYFARGFLELLINDLNLTATAALRKITAERAMRRFTHRTSKWIARLERERRLSKLKKT